MLVLQYKYFILCKGGKKHEGIQNKIYKKRSKSEKRIYNTQLPLSICHNVQKLVECALVVRVTAPQCSKAS